jgi:hypothetical protein
MRKDVAMTRPAWVALGISLVLVLSSTVLAADSKVLFVLDGSGSMQAKLNGQPKIDIARTVMGNLVKALPPEVHVGLETYGHRRKDDCQDIEMLVPVGRERTAVLQSIQTIHPKGKTPLTEAMRLAAAQFREYEGDAQVVVVSDGEETCGGDPCAAVREALAGGVRMKVHVVGFDVTPKEAEQLKCIAEAGNGKYFKAANAEELGKAFAQVKKEVVEKAEVKPPPAAPEKKVIKVLPTTGSIRIPNLGQRTTIPVYEQQSGKQVGLFIPGSKEAVLTVPAGIYKIQFQDYFLEGVEVVAGKATEPPIGSIKISNMGHGTIPVYEQQSGKQVGLFIPGSKEAVLTVPAGIYKIQFQDSLLENITVEAGQEVVLEQ